MKITTYLAIIALLLPSLVFGQKIVEENGFFGIYNDATDEYLLACTNDAIVVFEDANITDYVLVNPAENQFFIYDLKNKKTVIDTFTVDDQEWSLKVNEGKSALTADELVIIKQKGKVGLYQIPATEVVACNYDFIYPCSNKPEVYLLHKQPYYAFFNTESSETTPEFEVSECNYALSIDGAICYLDPNEYFPAKFDGKWAITNIDGKTLVEPEYDEIVENYISENETSFFLMRKGDKLDALESENINSLKIDGVLSIVGFWNELGVLNTTKGIVFIDNKGKAKELKLEKMEDNLHIFHSNCKYGVVNSAGDILLDFQYERVSLETNYMVVWQNSKAGITTTQGQALTPIKYDDIGILTSDNNTVLEYTLDEKQGLLSIEGKELTPPIYEFIYNRDGYKPAKKGGKFGYLNQKGELVIACQFDDADGFGIEGLAGVRLNDKAGFINLNGEIVIPIVYDYVDYFRNGKAKVKKDGREFYITPDGKEME